MASEQYLAQERIRQQEAIIEQLTEQNQRLAALEKAVKDLAALISKKGVSDGSQQQAKSTS